MQKSQSPNISNQSLHQNKGASGARANHNQMDRNYHNDRDKADVQGENTISPDTRPGNVKE